MQNNNHMRPKHQKLLVFITDESEKPVNGLLPANPLADRLQGYIAAKRVELDQRIFPISYTAGRRVVNKAGKVAGVYL